MFVQANHYIHTNLKSMALCGGRPIQKPRLFTFLLQTLCEIQFTVYLQACYGNCLLVTTPFPSEGGGTAFRAVVKAAVPISTFDACMKYFRCCFQKQASACHSKVHVNSHHLFSNLYIKIFVMGVSILVRVSCGRVHVALSFIKNLIKNLSTVFPPQV